MAAAHLDLCRPIGLYRRGIGLDCALRRTTTLDPVRPNSHRRCRFPDPASNVLTSLTLFAVVYSILFVATLYFGSRIIRQGPNLELPVPGLDNQPAVETEPATFVPDQRPLEAQQ
jgi:hypothetical protein